MYMFLILPTSQVNISQGQDERSGRLLSQNLKKLAFGERLPNLRNERPGCKCPVIPLAKLYDKNVFRLVIRLLAN